MGRFHWITVTAGLVVGVCMMLAPRQVAHAGTIIGSAHDFSSKGWSGGKICAPCHTPHNADTSVANSPLWNHKVTAATFTVYVGQGTMDATIGQPDGISKLCLSCHDGTVALDSFGGSSGTSFISGGEKLGTDLTNDHPVSFTYDDALATSDGELATPSTAASGMGGSIAADMLFNNKLECASCHDVHNTVANGPKLLVKSNAGSALCLTCHTK